MHVNLKQLALITSAGALAIAAIAPRVLPAHAGPPAPQPLVLTRAGVPSRILAAAPEPTTGYHASSVIYAISGTGPFCIDGLVLNTGTGVAVGPGDAGDVVAALVRINGSGLSHEYKGLFDGDTGGASPQDLVISYGSAICTSGSLELELIQYPATHGSGVAIRVWGEMVIRAAYGVTVTAT